MELSQLQHRRAQGSKPTHDFLSLYSPSEQDPTPTIPGGYMKTHDFLQPLEGNKVVKAEGVVISGAQSSNSNNNDENSNCSSYTGSGFTIWEECNGKNGKSGRNGNGIGIGMPWMTSGKVDTGNSGQKGNSPRSKHSATEQRRRSKINDRFSMLRGIIPNADQKRDKASFLLEVIEYIHFLQEKVNKYEDSYQGWTNEPPKMIPLNETLANELNVPKSISTNDKLRDEELIVESGDFNISTMYSQGISSALTEALKRSGVDLSEANISVQIDLGKRSSTNIKHNETPSIEESGEGLKRRRK